MNEYTSYQGIIQHSTELESKYEALINNAMHSYVQINDSLESGLADLRNEMYIKETVAIEYKNLIELLYKVDKKNIDNFYVYASETNYISIGCYDNKIPFIAKFDIVGDKLDISKNYLINVKDSVKHTDTTYIISDTKEFEKWIMKIGVYNFVKDMDQKHEKAKFNLHDEIYYIDPQINQYLPPKFAWDVLTEEQKINYYAKFYSQYVLIGFIHGVEYSQVEDTYIYTIITNCGSGKKDIRSIKLNEGFIAKNHKDLITQLLLNKISY